jgi:hypothetical protein
MFIKNATVAAHNESYFSINIVEIIFFTALIIAALRLVAL